MQDLVANCALLPALAITAPVSLAQGVRPDAPLGGAAGCRSIGQVEGEATGVRAIF